MEIDSKFIATGAHRSLRTYLRGKFSSYIWYQIAPGEKSYLKSIPEMRECVRGTGLYPQQVLITLVVPSPSSIYNSGTLTMIAGHLKS